MACTSSMLPRRNWTPFQAVDNSATGGRRSKTRTSWPSASNASTTWLPRNPDPPTTRDRTIASTDAGRNPHPQHSSLPRLTVPAAVSPSDLLPILKDGAQVPAGGSVASDDVSAHPGRLPRAKRPRPPPQTVGESPASDDSRPDHLPSRPPRP